ncbi:hypothetical protein [Candidatus Thiothrix anitrata]|jgi:hypothetical protein|uniref:Lipoprotein n=1 Tax=Candidatus Thiothrix anitrata TaxID=2823902 RepID=A0ABX7X786_9GAMM|nr:hypothetical protein [Candidatus Thiothrix anitrata]QTR50688.1 hypothetical protein J8380_03725 [Candidatus Thiothrix anitrata]
MKHLQLKMTALAMFVIAGCAETPVISDAQADYRDISRPVLAVDMRVDGDNSGAAREFPVNANPRHYRAYVQATPNERYRLRVTNNSGERVGVVIAVDGRNIISGKQSNLRNDERMYILEPYASGTYEGWRSGQNRTNRFFFTQATNSYAAAWGDSSALGVIALAAYAEKPRRPPPRETHRMEVAPAAAPMMRPSPGTGYGESTWSPSNTVDFMPVKHPMNKLFLKYEWRETLCEKRILPECRMHQPSGNRFWPENGGYAPPPPRR